MGVLGGNLGKTENRDKHLQRIAADRRYCKRERQEHNHADLVLQRHLKIIENPCRYRGYQDVGSDGCTDSAEYIWRSRWTIARYVCMPRLFDRPALEDASKAGKEDEDSVYNDQGP